MLLVKTYLDNSNQTGIGLFSGQEIKKGTVIWRMNETTTQIFWKKQFLSICEHLSNEAILDFIGHSYVREGNVYYLNDNSRFIRHAHEPNTAFKNSISRVAIKDIETGEELTLNYNLSFDDNDFFNWIISTENFYKKEDFIEFLAVKLMQRPRKIESLLN